MLIPPLARSSGTELLDLPYEYRADLSRNLADIRHLNRWFSDSRHLFQAIHSLSPSGARCSLLDVATGSGDVPLRLMRQAALKGVVLRPTGIDISSLVLDEARRVVDGQVELTQGDARSLSFANDSYDVVICCLAIHHFEPADAEKVLREMWRVCRGGLLVNDVYRSRTAYAAAKALVAVATQNRMTRHDAPLSVLRAYTTRELRRLAERAALHNITLETRPFFRQTLTARKHDVARS